MQANENKATIPVPTSAERRQHERVQCVMEASVDFSDVLKEVVSIMNLSEGGAKIEIPDDLFIPKRFNLSGLVEGWKVHCELVWRKGGEIGVRFVGAT